MSSKKSSPNKKSGNEFQSNTEYSFLWIYYSIDELGLHKEGVFINKINLNYDDIKKDIASELGISNDEIHYKSVPKIAPKYLNEELKFEIHKSCKDIDVMIHNGKKIRIKDGYKMKIKDFFEFLEKEGIYFSINCKYKIHNYSSGNEIDYIHKKYPFLSASQTSNFKVIFNDEAIELNFDKKRFFLSYTEGFPELKKLFKTVFHLKNSQFGDYSDMISIQNSHGELENFYSFDRTEKYEVTEIRSYIRFERIDKYSKSEEFWVNYCATPSDVQNQLFEKLKTKYELNIPECICLYDENKNPIPNSMEPLHVFQHLDKQIYYKLIPEYDYMKKIIGEKDAQIEEKDTRIEELERQLKEYKKNQITQKQDNIPFNFLSSDQIKNIEVVKKIGDNLSGNFSEVILTETIKQNYTLKSLKNTNIPNFKTFILKEHEILRFLDHPNIIKTYGITNGDDENPPIILLEHCINTLENAIKNNNLSKVEKISAIYEISEGMKYLHHKEITHRGLNPKNIFISPNGTMKISELGLSKFMTPKEQLSYSMSGPIGMIYYLAPELADDEIYDKKVDIYSFGVLIIFILNSAKITFDSDKKQIIIPPTFTKFTKNLISKCLSDDPKQRPDFDIICDNLKNNYTKLVDLDDNEKEDINSLIEEHS